MICIYALAWWGVFWLLIPRNSLFRVWAFVPAAICALAIPNLIWDFVPNAHLASYLGIEGFLLPLTIVVFLLVKKTRTKISPNNRFQRTSHKVRRPLNRDVGVR